MGSLRLLYPFDKVSGIKADVYGATSLVDDQRKSIALVPMGTAFDLSPEAEGYGGSHSMYGDGSGDGYSYGFGSGNGYGNGYGNGSGHGDGMGKNK